MERELYGDTSAQLAKTQKIIGILMIIMRNNAENNKFISADSAREYLLAAHAIFGTLRKYDNPSKTGDNPELDNSWALGDE